MQPLEKDISFSLSISPPIHPWQRPFLAKIEMTSQEFRNPHATYMQVAYSKHAKLKTNLWSHEKEWPIGSTSESSLKLNFHH